MSKRRVVVTGMGIVSPVGNDIASAWENVLKGNSGIGPVTNFDASAYATRIAGEVRDFDPVDAYFAGTDTPEGEQRASRRTSSGWTRSSTTASLPARMRCGSPAWSSPSENRRPHRRRGGCRHRRPAHDRGHRAGAGREGAAQGLAVLRAQFDHQHGRRQPLDLPRPQGPEHRAGLGLHHGRPQHRHGHAPDPVRRRRCDDRRRRRVRHHAHGHGRFLLGQGDVHAQRRSGACQPPMGRRPRRLPAVQRRGHADARGIRVRQGPRCATSWAN